ncbi:uncharacterized protein EI90DRAFT_3012143 [Cantharellus anzutake]|uniref:uncharacterized protein n=1 Tax=Cantharellus anzutake TaxID=1750568 RepID=UPI001904BA21|nr:uncharacterized protein EI90DRAFT_3012143 [Cantharellus anzutake]KAF8341628.1 hypothetical protein EI90DRAFT_3012143 [Cantharellus anzutake]
MLNQFHGGRKANAEGKMKGNIVGKLGFYACSTSCAVHVFGVALYPVVGLKSPGGGTSPELASDAVDVRGSGRSLKRCCQIHVKLKIPPDANSEGRYVHLEGGIRHPGGSEGARGSQTKPKDLQALKADATTKQEALERLFETLQQQVKDSEAKDNDLEQFMNKDHADPGSGVLGHNILAVSGRSLASGLSTDALYWQNQMPRKRPQNTDEIDSPADLVQNQRICVVKKFLGSNLYECWDGEATLSIELPPRFRKSIWMRRGSSVVVTLFETTEETSSSKLDGEIAVVLQPDQIKSWKKRGLWPACLDPKVEGPEDELDNKSEASEGATLPDPEIDEGSLS